jgi:arylsulfatase A-like enzyme
LIGLALLLAAGGALGVLRVFHAPASSPDIHHDAASDAAAGFNVLLVTLDTTRADHLGCYGYAAHTPNLDALAGAGLRFGQAIAPAPLTVPSHATMLTGLDPPAHGARDNGFRLADQRITLAEILTAHGYATAAFISSFVLDERFGLAQGFATYDDNCAPRGGPADSSGAIVDRRPAAAVTDSALTWLNAASHGEKPFFAWIHYYDAHAPCLPPREYAQQFPNQPYDGALAYVDAQLGRVLDLLRKNGTYPRTLIVAAGDHGEGLEEHGEPTHAYLIYDSTMRVPLILHNPALLGAPRVIEDRVVSLADILPTVLDLLKIPAPGPLDGRDLLTSPLDVDRAIYMETLATRLNNGWAALCGLRRLHDKYILAPRREYFDLRTDPGELNNLAAAAPPAMADLDARLAAVLAHAPSFEQVTQQANAVAPESLRRLATLGYVRASGGGPQTGMRDPKDMLPLWKRVMTAETKSLQGRHADAVAEIETALREDPTDGHAWYYAASIYARAEQLGSSEAAVRQALALSPSARGYASLAQLLVMRGVVGDEFEQALEAAKQLDPDHGGTYIARGDWYVSRGQLLEALSAYEKARQVDPANSGPTARQKIEWVRRRL